MDTSERTRPRNLRLLFKGIGALLILLAAGILTLGIIEIYCFYLFSEGGRFYYKGFGFGSFMFANLTFQILGYYGIAALAFILGYAHFTIRRWTQSLMLALLEVWLVVGLPMLATFFLIAVTAKELTLIAVIAIAILLALAYFVLPFFVKRFYMSRTMTSMIEKNDPQVTRFSQVPIRTLSVSILLVFFAGMLHVPVLLNGVFPLFGTWLIGLQGISCLAGSIVLFLVLAWGIYQQYKWAWWGTMVWILLLTTSMLLSFLRTNWLELLAIIGFPAYEIDLLKAVPVTGWHLAILFGLPIMAIIFVISISKKHLYTGLCDIAILLTEIFSPEIIIP